MCLGVQELERLEVAEAVGIAVGEAIDQHVDAAQVEIIAQARAADRELALVGGAEARPDQHARDEVEHVLQVGRARVLDRLLRDQLDPARRAVDVLARLTFRARALGGQDARLDDHRSELGRGGRSLREGGGGHGEDGRSGDEQRKREEGHAHVLQTSC